MGSARKDRRVCARGHVFHRSSACPVCPVCEREQQRDSVFAALAAPARRALENAGIVELAQLSTWNEADLLSLHGFGPSSIPKLRSLMTAHGLKLKAR